MKLIVPTTHPAPGPANTPFNNNNCQFLKRPTHADRSTNRR